MGAPKTFFFFITIHIIYVVSAQEMMKRVPSGFVGMRGKKYTDSSEIEQFYKRKPQFFVGVKGKKSLIDTYEKDQLYKRAPMGFVGMRGKKELPPPNAPYYPEEYEYVPKVGSLLGQIDYSTNEEMKSSNEAVYPMLNELLTEYLRNLGSPDADSIESEPMSDLGTNEGPTNDRITNEVKKRAANIHQFFGVRGKKSLQNKRPYDLTFRGKFIGVRGKKDVKNSGAQEIKFLLDQNGPWPKRKAQMGFFGMRGKKWTDDEYISEMDTE